MSDAIKPIQPPAEVVAVVRNAEHLIDRLLGIHGIDARRIRAVDRDRMLECRGWSLADELTDLLYRIFTDWDGYRTKEVEMLKKQVTELVMRMPGPVVFHKECLAAEPDKKP